MRLLVTAVGQRTEHWTDLFAVLARQPGLDVTVVVSDVSPLTLDGLREVADTSPHLHFQHLPHVLSEARSGHMASILVDPRALRRLDVAPPDVVHVIGEPAYLSTWQVLGLGRRRWPGVPVTHYAAQNVVTRFPAPFPTLERRAHRAVDHMFPITPAALAVLRTKGYTGPATIVPLGVDTGLFRPDPTRTPGSDFTVGFVGRLEPHKGVTDLLAAADRIGCALLVVGRGSQSGEVRAAAAANPRITLVDWADHHELPGLMARMDVLALPSVEVVQRNVVPWVGIPLREQFGRVLVEAMACGVPVVGSDVGEVPHVVGDAGLVFPAGDVDALVDRLVHLRDDPALARRCADNGVVRASDTFGWERSAQRMTEVWGRLSAARGHATDRERVSRR